LIEDTVAERALARAVVINHDDVDRLGAQISHLVVRIRAAIEGDEQLRQPALERAVDRAARQAVAVFGTPRHDETRIQAKPAQDHHEQRGAAHAVDIVVAQNHRFVAIRDGGAETRCAGLQVPQEKRVAERGERRLEKLGRRTGIADSGAQQELGQHPAYARVLAHHLHLRSREGRVRPAHGGRRRRTVLASARFIGCPD
jgi:hypothetical protein